jgi:hypothetical protein
MLIYGTVQHAFSLCFAGGNLGQPVQFHTATVTGWWWCGRRFQIEEKKKVESVG